jgi:MoaA/NifB/PqqE/SkfB family radical SAM enzyme
MYKISSRWPHQDKVKIEWNLGKRCNYDCTYCPAEIHDNISLHTDIQVLKSTVDKLITLGDIRISLTGGEPTVHPHITELIDYIKHVGVSWLSITTNGSRKPEWYINQKADHWVYSLHFTEGDWQRVLSTITSVNRLKHLTPMMVNVMAHHECMDDVRYAVEKLKQHSIPYAVRRIRWTLGDRDLFDDMRYDGNDLEWIKEQNSTVDANCIVNDDQTQRIHSNDIIKLHLNKFKNWTCYAGLESLMINWDGDVHRATCRVGGSLGNIYTGSFLQPTDPISCDRNFCTCAADIPITKINYELYRKL